MVMEEKREKYVYRRGMYGFGYDVYDESQSPIRTVVFSTPDRDQAIDVTAKLNGGADEVSAVFDAQSIPWPTQILVFEEKHGERYFIVNTLKDFKAVCKHVFEERLDQKWYANFDNGGVDKPVPPDFDESVIPSLPPSMQEEARKKWNRYKNEVNSYNVQNRTLVLFEKAKTGDPDACAAFVHYMRSAQYEGYKMVEPDEYTKL